MKLSLSLLLLLAALAAVSLAHPAVFKRAVETDVRPHTILKAKICCSTTAAFWARLLWCDR